MYSFNKQQLADNINKQTNSHNLFAYSPGNRVGWAYSAPVLLSGMYVAKMPCLVGVNPHWQPGMSVRQPLWSRYSYLAQKEENADIDFRYRMKEIRDAANFDMGKRRSYLT